MVLDHNESLAILKVLIGSGGKFSIRKLSQIRKINYKSAYNAVLKLEKEGCISVERLGNTNICAFSRNFSRSVFLAEDERRNDLIKNKDFLIIYKRLSEIPSPFIILLFGSHAKKTASRHSDIDLLAITDKEKDVEDSVSLLPLKIHLTSLTPREFISMVKSKEMTVVSEATKRNVILIGIEEYYRLMKNAG